MDLPNLDGLEEWERRKIMSVLQRDLDIQKQKDLQIRRLRAEIEKLSRLGENARRSPEKCCARCRTSLGMVVNSGAPCPKCHARICLSCRVQADGCRLGWICVLCDKTRQYAVLTGEWIQPSAGSNFQQRPQSKRGRNLTKSNSTMALRVRNTENDYFPASSAAAVAHSISTDASISGMLLRQLREESMSSWHRVDTIGLPPQTNRTSQNKLNEDNPSIDYRHLDDIRPRSPSLNASAAAASRASWRQSKISAAGLVGSSTDFSRTRSDGSYPNVWSSTNAISSNPVPLLRVEHIEEDCVRGSTLRKSWREETMERSLLNNFNRGIRCPSVPNHLETVTKADNSLTSLLSVTNVRVSVRSTSSDNVSTNTMGSGRDRERDRCSSGSQRSKQHSDNDIRTAVVAAFVEAGAVARERRRLEEKKSSMTVELTRPASQNSSGTFNDVSESWDDNASLSGDSVVSLGSYSVASSKKNSLKHLKDDSRGSFASSYSKIAVQGEILLACNYNCVDGSLEVHVIKCKNLYPMNPKKNRSNPYVKMYLLPDVSPQGKRKTRVKGRTIHPEFDEILKFTGLTKSEVEARTLLITAWHCDVLNRSHFLGEIHLKLSDYPWLPGETYWVPFGQHRGDTELEKEYVPPPDMMISLRFNSPDCGRRTSVNGCLQCLVRCPQNLSASRIVAGGSCYIKCYLYPDHRKQTKRKSPVFKLGADPTWNHTFSYDDVTVDDLRERCLELTVWSHQRMGSNEFLGGIRLNIGTGYSDGEKVDWMDSSEEETLIWKDVLYRPNVWIDATLQLRPDMESKL